MKKFQRSRSIQHSKKNLLLKESGIPVKEIACIKVMLTSESATSSNSKHQLFMREITIKINHGQKKILDLKISEFFYPNSIHSILKIVKHL